MGWADATQPYLKSTQIFQCPSESNPPVAGARYAGYTDYWLNTQIQNQSTAGLVSTSDTVMAGDGSNANALYYFNGCNVTGNPADITCDGSTPFVTMRNDRQNGLFGRHLDGFNLLFADGHAKWFKGSKIGGSTSINGSTAVLNSLYTHAEAGGKPTFAIN